MGSVLGVDATLQLLGTTTAALAMAGEAAPAVTAGIPGAARKTSAAETRAIRNDEPCSTIVPRFC
jgi:hypothetical protein